MGKIVPSEQACCKQSGIDPINWTYQNYRPTALLCSGGASSDSSHFLVLRCLRHNRGYETENCVLFTVLGCFGSKPHELKTAVSALRIEPSTEAGRFYMGKIVPNEPARYKRNSSGPISCDPEKCWPLAFLFWKCKYRGFSEEHIIETMFLAFGM